MNLIISVLAKKYLDKGQSGRKAVSQRYITLVRPVTQMGKTRREITLILADQLAIIMLPVEPIRVEWLQEQPRDLTKF